MDIREGLMFWMGAYGIKDEDMVKAGKELFTYLKREGIVRKVEGELPEYEFFDCADIVKSEHMQSASDHTIKLMLQAGYTKVEEI